MKWTEFKVKKEALCPTTRDSLSLSSSLGSDFEGVMSLLSIMILTKERIEESTKLSQRQEKMGKVE